MSSLLILVIIILISTIIYSGWMKDINFDNTLFKKLNTSQLIKDELTSKIITSYYMRINRPPIKSVKLWMPIIAEDEVTSMNNVTELFTDNTNELNFWLNNIISGKIKYNDFVRLLDLSPELNNSIDKKTLHRLYKYYLGRNATENEVSNIFSKFKKGIIDRIKLIEMLKHSDERKKLIQKIRKFVNNAYKNILSTHPTDVVSPWIYMINAKTIPTNNTLRFIDTHNPWNTLEANITDVNITIKPQKTYPVLQINKPSAIFENYIDMHFPKPSRIVNKIVNKFKDSSEERFWVNELLSKNVTKKDLIGYLKKYKKNIQQVYQ